MRFLLLSTYFMLTLFYDSKFTLFLVLLNIIGEKYDGINNKVLILKSLNFVFYYLENCQLRAMSFILQLSYDSILPVNSMYSF